MLPPRALPEAKLGATNVIVFMPQTTKAPNVANAGWPRGIWSRVGAAGAVAFVVADRVRRSARGLRLRHQRGLRGAHGVSRSRWGRGDPGPTGRPAVEVHWRLRLLWRSKCDAGHVSQYRQQHRDLRVPGL